MSEVKIGTEKDESKSKWNIGNFVYLKEGRKKRISTTFLKTAFALIAVLFIGFQLLSALKSDAPILDAVGIEPPEDVTAGETVNLDVHRGPVGLAKGSDIKAARTRPLYFEGIKPVSFKLKDKIPSGTEVPALLVSGGSNGIVKAKISEPVVLDGETIIEKDAVLLGQGNSSDERLYISFYKLIRRGSETKITAQAFDSKDRILGLKGSKVGDYAFKIAASSGLFFLSGMAEGMQEQSSSFLPQKKSMRDAALQGVAQATVEQGREMVNSMNNKSVIEVKHSTPIIVIFDNGDGN